MGVLTDKDGGFAFWIDRHFGLMSRYYRRESILGSELLGHWNCELGPSHSSRYFAHPSACLDHLHRTHDETETGHIVTWTTLTQDRHLHLHAVDAGLDRRSAVAGSEADRHIGAGLQSVETVVEIEDHQIIEVSFNVLLVRLHYFH